VRIAFSGAHRTGKSTLLEQLADALPGHATVDEPYYLLEEDGYETAEDPSLEDFQAQLERSLEVLEEGQRDVLFDRSPADLLAYLTTHEDGDDFDAEDWLDRVRDAMETLDLVVFVPIEDRDRIAVSADEGRRSRRAVHEKLVELLVDNLAWDVDVLRVDGDVGSRVAQVKARLAELR
jgi:predicted ATPase